MQEQEVNASANFLLLLIAAPAPIPQPSQNKIRISGCGVTSASESWELVVTVRLCPPRPIFPLSGSDVAGNMRVFQTRLESSNLSFRSRKPGVRCLGTALVSSTKAPTSWRTPKRASPSG